MIVVGVTGNFGTGKSTVCQMLADLGAVSIDADLLAHQALEDPGVREQVVREFGLGVLSEHGQIDRKRLGGVVFADRAKLEKLESWIHPRVLVRLQEQINLFRHCKKPPRVVSVEVPLLLEVGRRDLVDMLVVVRTDKRQQIERLMERRGLNEEDVDARLARQWPQERKEEFADFIINNSGTVQQTRRQAREVWQKLLCKTGTNR